MIRNFVLILLIVAPMKVLGATTTSAQLPKETTTTKSVDDVFRAGHKFITTEVGVGYSNFGGFMSTLGLDPQIFINREIAVGIEGYYSNYTDFEQYRLGPTVTDYFWHNNYFRTFVEQDSLFTHYTGSSRWNNVFSGSQNTLVGRSYAGFGWLVLDIYGGYEYATATSAGFNPGPFWGLRISMLY